MGKHTTGPWKVDAGTLDDDTNPRHVMASDGDYTCTAYGDTPQEADANAALIAAAPDLYEACKGMLEWARRVKVANPGMEVADAVAAIAKAGGGL